MKRSRAVPLALAACALAATAALASRPRIHLERIVPTDDGKLQVYASVVELEGNVVEDHGAGQFTLRVNGKSLGRAEKAARFQITPDPLDIVLIVESSALYGPQKITAPPPLAPPPAGKTRTKSKGKSAPPSKKGAKAPPLAPAQQPKIVMSGDQPLDKVKDSMHQLLEAMPPRARVLLIDYGGDVTPHPPFRPATSVGDAIDDLAPDDESGDLALSKAVTAALVELRKPRADGVDARKLIIVISDGLNSQMDKRTFRALGRSAQNAHVPIHTIGFSPTDARGPLLNLGEISKLSNGTFRWAKTADDLRAQVETLADEVNKQYVLTFANAPSKLDGQRFQLTVDDLESNVLIYGGPPPPSRGIWKWLLLLAAALGLIGAIAVVVARPRPKKRFATTRGGQPPGAQQQLYGDQQKLYADQQKQQAQQQQLYAQQQQQYAQQQQLQAQQQQRASTSAMIIVVSGGLAGQRFSLDARAPFIIGKGTAHLMITDDPTVSTRHAQVAWQDGFVLYDLNSTNGTYVNNQRVTQPVRLGDGDLVRFGNTQIKFRLE